MLTLNPAPPRILVTGANGFIGKPLCKYMSEKGFSVLGARRYNVAGTDEVDSELIKFVSIDDLGPHTDWTNILQDKVKVVVHLAGRAHILTETASDPLSEFQYVNKYGTEKLARAAAEIGIKRFIFISSIGVNGNITDRPFSEKDPPNPHNAYAQSKWEAEQCLHKIAVETGLEVVVIRLPLVYGPGVKANFKRLIKCVEKRLPLPLSLVRNKRSYIGLGNLIDFIMHVLEHPNAANKTYIISDGEDLSTPELIWEIASRLGRKALLFPFPVGVLGFLCRMLGQIKTCESLCGSLQVDCRAAKKELGWYPKISIEQELDETIKFYLSHKES